MTWQQLVAGALLVAACVVLFLAGPEGAREMAGALGGAGGVVLGGGVAKRGPR
jgi:hypothetical protein